MVEEGEYAHEVKAKEEWLVGWLLEFYGISPFVGYLMPNSFFIQIITSTSNNSV